ncbi:HU family DNA-binding protein [Sporolactobacillus spathodeae]|uniref:DNA-binding protein HU-beta n=1 Tax=Sporolactobacillus spathodeae TaxID=1465502 RepID=A0ABS2QAN6_9BACL|nr:HU family DNA-binding protein [Sporolactobacillus spathodeae]MBM7658829.1 DNA-binding protein HU-beta [Sporolactobacillus spathodeae]
MNKNELVQKVAEKTGMSRKDTEFVVNEAFDTIIETLHRNEKVQIVGFGTFEVRQRAERIGRNPQTGETITIPSTYVPGFRAGNKFKDAVKK